MYSNRNFNNVLKFVGEYFARPLERPRLLVVRITRLRKTTKGIPTIITDYLTIKISFIKKSEPGGYPGSGQLIGLNHGDWLHERVLTNLFNM